MSNRWWVLVRLLASECDSQGEFLTPVFWTWCARSGVTYFTCTPLRGWRGFGCCSPSEGGKRYRENCVQLLLTASRTAHQPLNSASAAPLSVKVLIFDSLSFSLLPEWFSKEGPGRKKEGIRFSRKQPACLSLPGVFESAQGSDWQTLTDRLTFAQPFPSSLACDLSIENSHISP